MIAYKGFTKELTSRLGCKPVQFASGGIYTEEKSKTIRSGFHCCENPFECLHYYSLDGNNRFFQVEAAGDIDEDDWNRISCSQITLIKELTPKELAGYGMAYMVQHPQRDGWEHSGNVRVTKDRADASSKGNIAISRGSHPLVKGIAGSILGLILEPKPGKITAARLIEVTGDIIPNTWYTIDTDRNLIKEDP
jgi:hypothetical protein